MIRLQPTVPFQAACRVALCVFILSWWTVGTAHAEEPWIRAGITGLGGDAYRITLKVHAPVWDGDIPTGCNSISSISIFSIRGAWAEPTNVDPGGLHRILEVAAGDIVWGADWLSPSLDVSFDLTHASETLLLDYRCLVDYFLHTQTSEGWDHFTPLDAQASAGGLLARLPAVGETVLFHAAPTGVESATWSRVKELFRSN